MIRLLKLLMIITLMVAPGTQVATAICRHQSATEHVIALASADAKVSNRAHTEETAASLAKKGTLTDTLSAPLLAAMPPPARLAVPLPVAEPMLRSIIDEHALPGRSVRPLLEPPAV